MKTIIIDGTIGWAIDARDIRRHLANAKGQDVMVEISSPGGSVIDGIEIFNLLRKHDGKVNTHIIGMAASMASYIALAGDRITAESNAVFMIHNAWTFVGGDHNEIRHRADIIEGLSNILAREYVKKTSKGLGEIKGLMDKETYLFGQGIMDLGFVDEIVDSGSDNDEASAIAQAKAACEECMARVKELESGSGYVDRVAAMIGSSNPQPLTIPAKNDTEKHDTEGSSGALPAGNKTNNTEDQMDLKEAMAKHPGLKAEIEARDEENHQRGIDVMQARIDKTAPYLAGSSYPAAVGKLAVKVLKGESEVAALEGAVTVLDAQKEAAASTVAGEEQVDDTPPHEKPVPVTEDGSIKTEADYQASLERAKKSTGNGGK